MTNDDHKKRLGRIIDIDLEDDDESGSGGTGSKIEQVDFMATGPSRDDLLPVDKKRHLLVEHKDKNKTLVMEQKETRDNYENRRKGILNSNELLAKNSLEAMRNDYLPHPILSKKLSGADNKVTPMPDEQIANTNEAPRNELRNEHQLRHRHTPRPSTTPKFTR